ncbi:MAG: alpha/beta fold hydrolase [Spirochaetales bacterium]|nr:alpha/beta fold hydrolase [Leptospiraceae bacterium]MCP5479862.1 alpha/beta fold hydrolase [Spirochaetales bacterium]MCP5486252.1 alpha/beta fold hydrolase [Spirochaetales bacterium]
MNGSLRGRFLLGLRRYRIHRALLAQGFRSRRQSFEHQSYFVYEGGVAEGTPLVLLHGFLDSSHTFRRVTPELLKSHRVYLIDLPGFGRSALPDIRALWHIPVLGRMIARFLFDAPTSGALALKEAIIFTHSLGGLVAAHATLYLHKVHGISPIRELHMIAPGLMRLPPDHRDEIRQMMFPETTGEVRALLNAIYGDRAPELHEFILRELLRQWSRPGYAYLADNTIEEEARAFLTGARLRQLHLPVHMYWGTDDRITEVGMGRRIQKENRSIRLHTFRAAGHALHVEQPAELLGVFYEQLNRASIKRTPRRPADSRARKQKRHPRSK